VRSSCQTSRRPLFCPYPPHSSPDCIILRYRSATLLGICSPNGIYSNGNSGSVSLADIHGPQSFFFQSVPAKAARFHLSTIGRVSEIMADAICYCSPYSTSPFFIILHGPKKYPPYSLMEADSFCLPERSVGTSCDTMSYIR
jgi:hypothetical protein